MDNLNAQVLLHKLKSGKEAYQWQLDNELGKDTSEFNKGAIFALQTVIDLVNILKEQNTQPEKTWGALMHTVSHSLADVFSVDLSTFKVALKANEQGEESLFHIETHMVYYDQHKEAVPRHTVELVTIDSVIFNGSGTPIIGVRNIHTNAWAEYKATDFGHEIFLTREEAEYVLKQKNRLEKT